MTDKTAALGNREPRAVRLWDRATLKENSIFETADHARYAVHPSGAFVRTNKDRRSPKERKRARRVGFLSETLERKQSA